MGKTSAELARKIVNLLLNDPGCSTHWTRTGGTDLDTIDSLAPLKCAGCKRLFTPAQPGRQYCSRACYDAYLASTRKQRVATASAPKRQRSKDALGAGNRFQGAPREYAVSRMGVASADDVCREIQERYGLKVSKSTVYRAWNRAIRDL